MNSRMLWQRIVMVMLLTLLFLSAVLNPAGAGPLTHGGGDDDYESSQVVVKLDPLSGATIDDINATYGTNTLEVLLNSAGIYLLQLPSGTDAKDLAEAMQEDARLLYAEPNFIGEAPEADPSRTWAWGGQDAKPFFDQYAPNALRLAWAQDISPGHGTVVAVLDTGIQLDHPALAASLTAARYDFVDDDPIPQDEFNGVDDDGDSLVDEAAGHGTHIAGIVHLVAPEAQIMPLRVLDSDGRGNLFIIAEAILYAARNGADVINLSLGTPWRSELLKDIIEDVTGGEGEPEDENQEKYDIIVVAAAGNLNTSVKQYPAAEDGVLAVTSVGPTATKSAFANFGDWIDVAAPGEGIYSTFPNSGYAWWSGTSMAAPFVAGQAALIKSIAPSLKNQEVMTLLIKGTARPLDAPNPAFVGQLGAGEPDIGASLGCHWADVWPDATHDILHHSCDGIIDLRDLMSEAEALGFSGNLAAPFDNNGDDTVDLADLQRVALRWRMRKDTPGTPSQ